MKKNNGILNLVIAAVVLGATGCATTHHPDSAALQGTWKGQEVGANSAAPCYLVITGQSLEFRGANPNEWYKGTFELRENTTPRQALFTISDCAAPKYVGKIAYAIYELKDGTLTMAGTEPGSASPPAAFNEADARQFVFKRE